MSSMKWNKQDQILQNALISLLEQVIRLVSNVDY